MEILRAVLLIAAAMTMGLMAGVGLYANTIMPGLRSSVDRTFVGAFQSIDRAIINPTHWTPPRESPRRFATWFFVVEAPYRVSDIVVDGGEIIDHVWTAPHEALARQARREIQLATPTWVTLHELAKYADPPEAVEAARARGVENFATRLAELNGTKIALWAGDVAYATGDATRRGARHRLCMPSTGAWTYQRTAGR